MINNLLQKAVQVVNRQKVPTTMRASKIRWRQKN